MNLLSPAFNNNEFIPKKYSPSGENINPPLIISDVPQNAQELVLIMDDPDAPNGIWTHWLVWNISPATTSIDEDSTPEGAITGPNSSGDFSYDGPMPPSGTHRYFFRLYALAEKIDLPKESLREQIEKSMQEKIIDQTELIGLYKRN